MIVMVSTKTLSARLPDQSASTKPSEMTSKRPPSRTSSMVGSMTLSTALSVSAAPERSTDRCADVGRPGRRVNWSVT
jgi:hypothetical protein